MCLHPGHKKDDFGKDVVFPCGSCPECRADVVNDWAFRLLQELRVASFAICITLTYDIEHVPINDRGAFTLDKRDLQLFWKKLRRKTGTGVKYFVVGEYGSCTMRPHYHACVFNCSYELIENTWLNGGVNYGVIGEACVRYIMKYIMKPGRIKKDDEFDRLPEFRCMSKGLGASYLNQKTMLWHYADFENRCYVNLPDGKKSRMPRYYRERLYYKSEREYLGQIQVLNANTERLEALQKDIDTFGYAKAQSLKKERLKAAYSKMFRQSLKGNTI